MLERIANPPACLRVSNILFEKKSALFIIQFSQTSFNFSSISFQLVSWSLTSLFSTNMAISETKGQGWKVIRTQ